MSEQTDPIDAAEAPAADTVPHAVAPAPTPTPVVRRTVTLPVLPLAIVGGIIVAVLFFGGGVAIGWGIGLHDARDGRGGNIQQFRQGQNGTGDGTGNGFPGQRPTERPGGTHQQNG